MACTTRRLEERARARSTGRLYTQLPVRHWDEWLDGRRNHLFVVPLAGGAPGRPHEGHGGRLPVAPLRRRRRLHLHARRQGSGLRRQGRRPRRGLVHQPRPLVRPRRRLGGAAQPHAGQPGLGRAAGLLARTARRSPGWPWRSRATRPTATASWCATGPTARCARWRRAGTARPASWPGRPTAARSSPPPTTWAPTRSSPSTWPPARERLLVQGRQQRSPVRGGRPGRLHPRRPGLPGRPLDGPARRHRRGPHHPRQRRALWPASPSATGSSSPSPAGTARPCTAGW